MNKENGYKSAYEKVLGMKVHKKYITIFLILFLGILTLFFTGIIFVSEASETEQDMVLNEICSSNFSIGKNKNGKYCDYIEIYNPTTQDKVLDGYYLSDDKEMLCKYSLQNMSVPAKGYLVVWLDEMVDGDSGNVCFGISADGESVYLVKGDDEIIVDSVYVPKLAYNTCYARSEDGVGHWNVMETSIGETNTGALSLPVLELEEPGFSVESGFYEEKFYLKLRAKLGEEIYYTLDGSEPTIESIKYTGKIEISDCSGQENVYAARKDLSPTRDYTPNFKVDKATVVRAVSYDAASNKISDVATKVYFIGYKNQKEYENFPVISLVADPEDLFDYEKGIYGNGKKFEEYKENGGLRDGKLLGGYVDENGQVHNLYEASNAFNEGKEWEREANFIYFNEEHEYEFTQDVGIRIAGASTRGTPQKSFNIYGRDIYDKEVIFPYEFFEGIQSSTIKLRNGGNHNDGVKIIDAFVENLVEDRDVSIQRSKPCILFLNGEYWGIYNIRERYNEEYINTYYGVSEENVWIIDGGRAKAGESAAWEAYQYFVTMATECDLTYDDVYAMVSEFIDVQSFIDFCCINMYLGNGDLSFGQNMAMWRSAENDGSKYGDCKWRWMVFDVDEAIGDVDGNITPGEWMKNYCLMQEPILQSFMKNAGFREQFYKTLLEIGKQNFDYETISHTLKEWKGIYEEQLLLNHQRFFNEGFGKEQLDEEFTRIDHFFAGRYEFIEQAVEEVF